MDTKSHPLTPSGTDGSLLQTRQCRPSPVFLHSGYRTGSTWLWQKMRQAPKTLAFYEVFHEFLATITPAQVRTIDFAGWDSRHPVSTPYFLEFLPLVSAEGGISGFDASMPFDTFVPRDGFDGELQPTEKSYIEQLLKMAWANQRIPVLSCTRSLGRARALRRQMGGHAMLLHRNMFHQWASFCWQSEIGNDSFFDSVLRMVKASGHDAFLRDLAEWFGLHQAKPCQAELFEVFIIAHLYFYSIAFDACDLIVDLDEVATDRPIQRSVEQQISDLVASEIDLSDARQHCEYTSLTVDAPARVKDTIEQFAKLIPGEMLSAHAGDFVRTITDRALTEWDRYEFFTRRTRTVLAAKVADAEKQLKDEGANCGALAAENERLVRDREELQRLWDAERSQYSEALAHILAERDELALRLHATEASRQPLDQTCARLAAAGENLQASVAFTPIEGHAVQAEELKAG